MAKQQGQSGGAQIPLSLTQRGFGGGELGPQLLGRADQAKYSTGLQLCRNMQIERHGAVVNRAGTIYCGNAANQSAPARLRPFMYDSFDGYLLEMSASSMRVWALGAPLGMAACPAFLASGYAPAGQIVTYGTLPQKAFWTVAEQWQGAPITLTITPSTGVSYAKGLQMTLTASAALWTNDMAYSGAVVQFQICGGPIIHVTLNRYTSSTVIAGTADIDIPANLQNTATVLWQCTSQVFNVLSVATPITMEITSAYWVAGSALTIVASAPFFSNEMVTAGTTMIFQSSVGPIPLVMTSYSNGQDVGAISTVDIPAELQGIATLLWSTPATLAYQTVSPIGPTFPAGAITITMTAISTGFAQGSLVTVTASGNAFTAGMATQAITVHDATGAPYLMTLQTYSSATSFTALCQSAIPASLQNVAIVAWSTPNVAPAAGPFWVQCSQTSDVEIPIALPQAALASLVTSQYTNTMTVASQSFAPFQLTRTTPYTWAATPVASTPGILPPIGLEATIGYSSTLHLFDYYVTAVNAQGVESLPSNPVVCLGNYPSSTNPNIVSWEAVVGAVSYNVYGTSSANISTTVPGLLGSSITLSFNDVGGDPDVADQPPAQIPLFQTTSDYPAVTSYFQQRLIFANTANHPQRTWMSQTNQFLNFAVITPTSAASAIEFDIPGQLIQPVSALVDIGKFVLHTASNEYICTGDVTGAITSTAVNPAFQGGAGCSLVQPVRIGITDIFVQARGGQIRDLTYTIQSVSYAGKDLTIFNPQLFLGQSVIDMAWQNIKDSIVWCLMKSGQLFGLTYIREHEIWAWHHHDTGGAGQVTTAQQQAGPGGTPVNVTQTATTPVGSDIIESISVVPEGQNDTLYLQIKRTIAGAPMSPTVRYIERMAPREFIDQVALSDAVFSDSSVIYDGRNTGATTMTMSGSSWAFGTLLTVTASAPTFASSWVGQAIVFQQYNASGVLTDQVTITVNAYTSTTIVQGYPDKNVPIWAQSAILTWGHAVTSFTGATNLAGMPVSVLADGNVQSSPNNIAYPTPIVVSDAGAFTIPVNALVVCVGLPFVAQLQTLPLENLQGETITNKMINVNEVTGMFYATRGGFWGMDFNHLFQWNQRNTEPLSSPVTLFTGPARIPTQGTWEITGQACLAQLDPLPVGISALTVSGYVGR